MKNLLRKGLLFLCVLMLAAAMTACGSDDSDNSKKDDKKTEETTPADDSSEDDADAADSEDSGEVDTGVTADGKFKSLEGFVNSDIMQEQMESQMESLEGTGISCALAADGDKLVYNFTIEDEDLASVMDKATLDSQLESMASTFESIASTLPDAVEGVENPAVVVRYLDPAGEEITSMEFTAE